jgi:hypothetical protein
VKPPSNLLSQQSLVANSLNMAKFSYVTGTRDRTRAITLRVRATLENKLNQKSSVVYFHSKNAGKMHFLVKYHFQKKILKMHFLVTSHPGKMDLLEIKKWKGYKGQSTKPKSQNPRKHEDGMEVRQEAGRARQQGDACPPRGEA